MYQQLSGRLGNQLFQWAYSHCLYDKYSIRTQLFYDKSHNGKNHLSILERNCSHCYEIKKMNSLGLLLKSIDRFASNRKIQELIYKFRIYRTYNSYEFPRLEFQKPFLISGFYINSSVVMKNEEILFSEIMSTIIGLLDKKLIENKYQVFHLRRGDYLMSASDYGCLSLKYYERERKNDMDVYLTTDEENISKEIIDVLKPTKIFTPKNSNAWDALALMAFSENLVMANSTLSWWGGFLASKLGAVVIAPSPFYKNISVEEDAKLKNSRFIYREAIFD